MLKPWYTTHAGPVFSGSTLGHEQQDPVDPPIPILEVYQVVQGYAAMLIDRRGESGMELVVLSPGDKVGTSNNCIMTIFGLGDGLTQLLDIANPDRHQSNKRIQHDNGPSLVMQYAYGNFRAQLSPHFVGRRDGYGVAAPRTQTEITISVPNNRPKTIYEALLSEHAARKFALRGIRVTRPDNDELAVQMGIPRSCLSDSLATLRKDVPGHPLREYFFGTGSTKSSVAIHGGGGEIATERIMPAFAAIKSASFDCVEMRDEPLPSQKKAA